MYGDLTTINQYKKFTTAIDLYFPQTDAFRPDGTLIQEDMTVSLARKIVTTAVDQYFQTRRDHKTRGYDSQLGKKNVRRGYDTVVDKK